MGVDETDSDFTLGKTGGEKTHRLTVSEMPAHSHTITLFEGTSTAYTGKVKAGRRDDSTVGTANTASSGSNAPHNNLQPYVAINYWRRIA